MDGLGPLNNLLGWVGAPNAFCCPMTCQWRTNQKQACSLASLHHLATEATLLKGLVGMSQQVPCVIVHREQFEAVGTLPLGPSRSSVQIICRFIWLCSLCRTRGCFLTRSCRGSSTTRGWRGSFLTRSWSGSFPTRSWRGSCRRGDCWGGGGRTTSSIGSSFFIVKTAEATWGELWSRTRRRKMLARWRAWHLQQTCLAWSWCVLKPYHVFEAKRLGDTEELLEHALTNIKSPVQNTLQKIVTHTALLPIVAVHQANDKLDHVWADAIQDNMLDFAEFSEEGDFQWKKKAVDVVVMAFSIN